MGFEKGDRVFVGASGLYGTVTKNKFLGKYGLVIKNDNGSISAFNTVKANAEIYDKETGTNGDGVTIDEIPMDVKEEGREILTNLAILPEQQTLFYYKFLIGLTTEEQHNYVNEFNLVKGDETKKQLFLAEILATLEDDQKMIFNEGSVVLFRVDPEIRAHMFEKLLTEFPKEQREELIVQWVEIKTNRGEKEKFLHEMYLKLMEKNEYIQTEGIRGLTEFGLGSDEQKALFGKFLAVSTDESKQAFVQEWIRVRSSRSRRRFFLNKIIKQLETSDA